MSSGLLVSAIPYVLRMLGDRFDADEILGAIRKARKEQCAVHVQFASFDWDAQIMATVPPEKGTYLDIRDVVELPEFRERLSNILTKKGKHKCTVFPIVRDVKVLKDDDVIRDDALISVVFSPWSESDTVTPCACILRGNKSDKDHVLNKRGVCWYCGAYEGDLKKTHA